MPSLSNNQKTVSIFIFCAAFSLRLFYYLAFKKNDHTLSLDTIGIHGWLEIARNLAAGKGYTGTQLWGYLAADTPQPTATRGPFPVMILALLILIFKNHYYPVLFLLSWTLSAFTAVMLYFLTNKILRSNTAALAASSLYCIYLPEISISTVYAAGSESLFTFLLICYFSAVIRNIETKSLSWAFMAGGALGLACLSKPVVIFFPVLYAVWLLRKHGVKAMSSITCFFAIFLLILSPWVIRNQIVFHKAIFTTTGGGYVLLRGNAMLERNEYVLYNAEKFDPIAEKTVSEAGYDIHNLNQVKINEIFRKKALGIISKYPWRYIKLCVIRTSWLWYKIQGEHPLLMGQNIIIYLFMVPGFFLALARRHALSIFAFHIFYFVLFYATMTAQFRYICPMMPYGIIIAIYAVFNFIEWVRFRRIKGVKLDFTRFNGHLVKLN